MPSKRTKSHQKSSGRTKSSRVKAKSRPITFSSQDKTSSNDDLFSGRRGRANSKLHSLRGSGGETDGASPTYSTSGYSSSSSTKLPDIKLSRAQEQNRRESLRWDNQLADPEEERKRLEIYKMNRRKRYMADAQARGITLTVSGLALTAERQALVRQYV